jgi:hypothetical protein
MLVEQQAVGRLSLLLEAAPSLRKEAVGQTVLMDYAATGAKPPYQAGADAAADRHPLGRFSSRWSMSEPRRT